MNSTIKDLFIIKFLNSQKEYKYAIDCEEIGYLTIKRTCDIAQKIIYMNTNDILDLYGDKFTLIYRSKPVIPKITVNQIKHYTTNQLKEKLIEVLKKYNELGFFHETHIDNLESIYKEQYIYSRNKLQEKNIYSHSIAEYEVLKRTNPFYFDCARFYLRSNTPANYKFEGHTCILVCNYDIINSNNYMYITDLIATKNPKKNYLNNNMDLIYILTQFQYDKIYDKEYIDKYNYDRNYKLAEFLTKNAVPLKYIDKIIFKNENDKTWFKRKFPNWKIQIIIDKNFFEKSYTESRIIW